MAIHNFTAVNSSAERNAIIEIADPLSPGLVYRRDLDAFEIYDPDLAQWFRYDSSRNGAITSIVTFTTVVLNGGSQTLVAAQPGYKFQLVDFTMVAIGGAAATATSVRISGTQSASVVRLATVLVAALTQSTAVKPNSANVTMLADAAWLAPCDVNTALTIDVNNNNLATATSIRTAVTYQLIPA